MSTDPTKATLGTTVEDMLQIGYGCGLTTVGEAFQQLMSHHDCFFLSDSWAFEMDRFYALMEKAGLARLTQDQVIIEEMTIKEACDRLGIVLREVP